MSTPARPDGGDATPEVNKPVKRRRRWGVWTLAFLGLAMISMITAQTLGSYTVGTFGSLIFGLVGAGYCTFHGLREAREVGLDALLTQRRPPKK
jgi:peptidoglycan/LPS O-acetylase OafA/YrhL